jgi:RNA polymerase sigma-70 factor (ECF subfamily)
LIERTLQGDLAAFDELVRDHQAFAQRLTLMLGLAADDAADAAQEGFIRAYRALRKFKVGRPFRPWLAKIIVNEVRSSRRQRARRTRLSERLGSLREAIGDSPELDSIRRERAVRLVDKLAALADHDRLPIVYRYFLQMSEAEAAEALGVPRGTVKSRLSRALAKLQTMLREPT